MLGNEHEASGESPDVRNFNCWQSLKPLKPQRRDETDSGAKAAKAEKIERMAQGVSLNAVSMGLQQLSLE